ncbi:DUF6479 family protein [Streptomyces sp. TRM68367]|uniref:DUF6479 family protein n=1 Tax=Streptomyces sp. TRM68367 TaxID=2758415 RepID=UPI00165C4770|nr:DUF6479 family protein [Streptomyces sp. TRM68367]MBC9728941.1 hypothetical protein [Streptomyces sp. TRM68367]
MSTETFELLAETQDVLNVAAAFFGGLFVAGALILAVRIGMRVLDKDIHHPSPEEQPRLPMTGPIHEEREMREPDEIPVAEDGTRLMPYELHHSGSRRGKDQRRRRWLPGSSGGFGSGGPGHV